MDGFAQGPHIASGNRALPGLDLDRDALGPRQLSHDRGCCRIGTGGIGVGGAQDTNIGHFND